jgi:hypothetical protein
LKPNHKVLKSVEYSVFNVLSSIVTGTVFRKPMK